MQEMQEMQETQIRSLDQEDPPGVGNANLLQYSCLENSMDQGACWAESTGITRIQMRLSTQTHTHTHTHTHSSVTALKILCVPLFYPHLLANLWQPLIFLLTP